MKFVIALRNALLTLPLLILLAACAAQEPENTDPGVEDLAPGQRTVIAPPSGQSGSQSGVQEKNL